MENNPDISPQALSHISHNNNKLRLTTFSKVTLTIIIISLVAFAFTSCKSDETKEAEKKTIEVKDNLGYQYKVVTIEGCEFYRGIHGKKLTKVDCDCKPDKSLKWTKEI